jgi:hemerythrin-like metal-binding protein
MELSCRKRQPAKERFERPGEAPRRFDGFFWEGWMPFMHWTPAMSVGLSELDEDHKQLFYLINRLADQAAADDVSVEAIRDTLFALMRYAELHFSREERVMTACDYPQLHDHLGQHKRFVERIKAIAAEFDADAKDSGAEVGDALLEYLKDWLTHHILIQDMAYKPFVEAKETEARQAARSIRGVEIAWSV